MITKPMLQSRIDSINSLLGYHTNPFFTANGRLKCYVGTFYIGKAYGGYRIEQMMNEDGGCRDISDRGTKRECYNYAKGIIEGIKQTDKRDMEIASLRDLNVSIVNERKKGGVK